MQSTRSRNLVKSNQNNNLSFLIIDKILKNIYLRLELCIDDNDSLHIIKKKQEKREMCAVPVQKKVLLKFKW